MSIKVTCSRCGSLEIGEWEIAIIWGGPHGEAYSFVCPSCDTTMHRPAPERVLRLLALVGAREAVPPITEDEIERFVDGFDDEAIWRELG